MDNPADLMIVEEQVDGSAIVDEPLEETPIGHTDNLARTLDPFKLNRIAAELLDLIEKDKEARKARDKQQEEGIRRTGLGDDAPGGALFDGASKVVHPMLAEGCVDFSARAMKELMPAKGPVRTRLLHGKADQPTVERAKRKADYLNFQIMQRMHYREEKERELTQLPLGGSQYMKFWPENGKIQVEFVPIDKVFLPYSAGSFYTAQRMTHEQELTEHTFESRVRSGFYVDLPELASAEPDESASQKASNKIEGKESSGYNEDGVRIVYECTCFYEIEDEDAKPYVVHLDEPTGKIVGLYRNWAQDDPTFEKLDWWQEDTFIPWRGAVGIGLLHLIGSIAASATGAIRAIMDSALINNAPTAIKLKGSRTVGQNVDIALTEVQEIDVPTGVDDIRKAIMPMPFNPPSPVLAQLVETLTNMAKGVVATAEERIADASNTMPVGTALALIEQGSQVFSSIHARLHAGQKKALDIICRLNRDYPNLEEMQRFGVTPQDFSENDDIDPVSDPNIFSESQRYAQLQETLKLLGAFPNLPWKVHELARRSLELLRVEYSDEILPPVPSPLTSDPVTENFNAAMSGIPLKATAEQDHIAHLHEHLRFLCDPLLGAGPLLQGPQLQGIMHNISEHMMYLYTASAKAAAMLSAMRNGQSDAAVMDGAALAGAELNKMMQGILPEINKAQQIIASKMPQPPIDPAVQKAFESAMAEVERKKTADKMQHDREMGKISTNAQIEAIREDTKKQIADRSNFLELQLASAREQAQRLSDELTARVALMKNEQDNQQHEHTEIVKNLQDNYTQLQIAMQRGLTDVRNELPQSSDMSPVIEQLNGMLSKVEKQKSEDALSAVMVGLQEVIKSLNRPKMIIHDEQGKPVGVQ